MCTEQQKWSEVKNLGSVQFSRVVSALSDKCQFSCIARTVQSEQTGSSVRFEKCRNRVRVGSFHLLCMHLYQREIYTVADRVTTGPGSRGIWEDHFPGLESSKSHEKSWKISIMSWILWLSH